MAQSIQHDPTALILELSAASTPNIHSPIAAPGSQLPDAIVSIPLVQNIRQVNDDGAFPIAQEISEDKLALFCRDYDRMLRLPHEKPLRGRTVAVGDPGPLPDDDSAFQITQEISEQFCRDYGRMLQSLSPHEKPLRGRTVAVGDPGPLPDDDSAFQITQEISEPRLTMLNHRRWSYI